VSSETIALVTGASSGIGTEFCRQLADRCDRIIATGRRRQPLLALASELKQECEVVPLVADLATVEGQTRVVEALRQRGPVDYLVNNAGFCALGAFDTLELDPQQAMVRVHIDATLVLCRAAIPFMKERGGGAIINVSSLAAFEAHPLAPIYSASKAFLNNFSRSLHLDVEKSGMRVQALCPGFTITEFHDRETMAGFDRNWVPEQQWMDASQVVSISLSALEEGRVVVVPGEENLATARSAAASALTDLG
jgi:short-subunit dehydrogenase